MPEDSPRFYQFELLDYVGVLRRQKWSILLALLVVVGTAAWASSQQAKVYVARALVLVNTERADESAMATEIILAESQPVRDAARRTVPGLGAVSAGQVGKSRVLALVVQSSNPALAAAGANAYANAYIEFRQKRQMDAFMAAAAQVQTKLDEIQGEISALSAKAEVTPAEGQRRTALISRQVALEDQLRDLEIRSPGVTGTAELVTPASRPTAPIRPKPINDAARAVGVGLLFGVALAFLREYLDDTINTGGDVARAAGPDLPVLGTIPSGGEWRGKAKPKAVTLTVPTSRAAEAYRSLRTALQFMDVEGPAGALAVTSPINGEGKSTIVANLAVVMAQAERPVILLDCDLREPSIHQFFDLRNDVGLTSVMLGGVALSDALQRVPGFNRLWVLPTGPLPPNPSELLTSDRFRKLIGGLGDQGAWVLIDTPALLPVTDGAVVATSANRVILVVRAGRSTRKGVRRAVEVLQQVDAPLAGLVVNGLDPGEEPAYTYKAPRTKTASSPPSSRGAARGNGARPSVFRDPTGFTSEASGPERRPTGQAPSGASSESAG